MPSPGSKLAKGLVNCCGCFSRSVTDSSFVFVAVVSSFVPVKAAWMCNWPHHVRMVSLAPYCYLRASQVSKYTETASSHLGYRLK